MANRSVVVDLIVNTSRWTSGFQRASHDMASATTNAETKVRALQNSVGLLGIGLTAFAAVAVAKWAQFDAAMSRVEATGGSAAEQIDKLNAAALSDNVKELGYSASEAAESIYELTKAGVSAEDIIGGGLSGALSLAAAESMDASESASILASALTQFNLTGEDSAHVADLLVAAAGKAQGSAHDLGFALKQSGLVADQFGLSIEETTGTLALFANAGLIGSDAGTSLRTMLLHLAGPSGKSARLMDELGFSAYDAGGQFKSMEELADSLGTALNGKSEAEKNAALTTIFGADATRAASLLLREGGDAVVEWTEKVNDAGYATSVAFKRLDNLNGDLKKLSSTFDQTMIKLGSNADGPLRGLVQGVTAFIDALGDAPDWVMKLVMALAGGGGLAVVGILAISRLFNAISTLKVGLVETGVVGQTAANRIATGMKIATLATGALLTAATIGLSIWANKVANAEAATAEWKSTLDDFGNTTNSTLSTINENLSKSGSKWYQVGEDQRSAAKIAEDYGVAISDVQEAILGSGDAYDKVRAQIVAHKMSMGQSREEANILTATEDRLLTSIKEQRQELKGATTEAKDKARADIESGVAADGSAAAQEELAQATAEAAEADRKAEEDAKARADAISALVDKMFEQKNIQDQLAGEAGDQRAAHRAYEASIDAATEALKKNGETLDVNTEKGRDNQDKLDAISDSTRAWSDALLKGGASQGKVNQVLADGHKEFVDMATSMGMSEDKANALADSLGLIDDVDITVDADTVPALDKSKEAAAEISDLKSVIALTADPSLARDESENTAEYISRLQATLEIDGYDIPARKKGESAQAYIDRLLGVMLIDGDEHLARKKGESAQQYIDRLEGVIDVTSDTYTAEVNAEAVRRTIDAMKASIEVTAHTTVNGTNLGAQRKAYTGAKLSGFASGGRLPGDPPKNPREDNLLGVDGLGVPRVRVRSGEWVVNQRASDYYGDGLMRAVNERRVPKTALMGYASGGRIDYTPRGHSLEFWENRYRNSSDRLDLQIQQRNLRRDLREKEKGKYTLTGLDRKRAQMDLNKATAELSSAKTAAQVQAKLGMSFASAIKKRDKENDKAKAAKEKAADTKSARAQSAKDYRTAISRGEVKSDLTSGMSGVYGVTDDARELLRSGQVTGKAGERLATAIRKAESSAKGLYAQSAKIATALEKAKDKAEELHGIKDSVASGISEGFGLSGVEGTMNQWTGERAAPTGQQFLAAAQAYAGKAKNLALKLRKLQERGFSGVILQEVAGMGVDAGTEAADALLTLDTKQAADLNKAYTDIDTWAGRSGQVVTEGFFKGGAAAADGIVQGLQSKQKQVEDAITKMALAMQDALKKALGIKSPSRVFRAMMKFVGDGAALGLEDQRAQVSEAASKLLAEAGGTYTSTPSDVAVTLPYVAPSPDLAGLAAAGNEAVTKADLKELAGMIVQGFETGTMRHLKGYTQAQKTNQMMQTGFRR